jgi:hypothetical protein
MVSLLGTTGTISIVTPEPPIQDPLLDQPQILAFHQLTTAIKVRLDPAIEVGEALRHHPSAITQMSINRKRISIPKPLDDHEEQSLLLN